MSENVNKRRGGLTAVGERAHAVMIEPVVTFRLPIENAFAGRGVRLDIVERRL